MAIRERLASMLGAKASIIGLSSDELPDRALEKAVEDLSLLSVYKDDEWPYILATKTAEQASQAPLQVGRTKKAKDGTSEFEPVGPDHPVQQLLDSPNELMDGGEFIETLWLYMELTGHSPIEVSRATKGGRIGAPGRAGQRQRSGFELWLVNPSWWRIVANPDATIKGYLWVKDNPLGAPRWEPDEMTYLRWPNPNDRWYGQGRVTAVRNVVMAEEYASVRDKKFEKQLGVPPGILTSELPLGEPQAIELQKRWEQAVGGYRNAGRIAVLGSKTTYQPIIMSARDAQWLEQRKHRVETMAAAFGVPMPLVLMQDAKFANAQEARAELWEGTLQPRLNRIARMLTTRLLPLITTEPLEVRFDYTQVEALGENDLEAAQTATAWSNTGSVTVGEVRKRLGLPPLPDTAFNARLLVPSTLTIQDPAEVAAAAAMGLEAQQAGIEGTRATTDATKNPPKEPVDGGRKPPPKKPTKADAPDRAAQLAPVIAGYASDLTDYFVAQRHAVVNGVTKALPLGEDERDLIHRIIDLVSQKKFRDRLLRISRPPIETGMTLGATEAARTLGVGVSYAIPASEAAVQRVTTHLQNLGVGIENTTVTDVSRVLREALDEGVDNAAIRDRLGKLFDDYADWRVDRISRTEVQNAYNLGSLGQYKDVGVSEVHVSDGDLDEPCADADGATWTVDRAEQEPTSHPNCTRVFSPVTNRLDGPDPEVTKTPAVNVHVHLPETMELPTPVVHVSPPEVNVAAPIVNVEAPPAPLVTVEAAPAPVVNMEAMDVQPFTDALHDLRRDILDVKADLARPRTREVVRDQSGRVTGSREVVE